MLVEIQISQFITAAEKKIVRLKSVYFMFVFETNRKEENLQV